MAFQAQQAPNYQGAASDMGGHLASMGKANMTYALAKRARDEKRADIKLQKEKDERSFILGNIREGLGIMRENTLLKREDKQKAQIQENWKSLEPERISKLHNSLNNEWSIEYAQKQRELNKINSAGAKEHADNINEGVFQPVPMSEYLRTNPLIAKRHTLAEAAQRYHGGIGGEEAGVLKETSTESGQGVAELHELERQERALGEQRRMQQGQKGATPTVEEKPRTLDSAERSPYEERVSKGTQQRISGSRMEALRREEEKRRAEQDEKERISEERRKGREIGKRSVALSKAKRAAKKSSEKREAAEERKRAARSIVTSSKVQREIKQGRKDEMDKWSKEFEEVTDKQAREDKAQAVVAESKDKRKRQEAYKKAEAVAQRKRKEKAKREADAERKAVAQETVETSKRKRKAESIMEKIKQEKEKERAFAERNKQEEVAGTSLREEAAAADDKLVQQFDDNAAKYEGTRKLESLGKKAASYAATLNRKVWNDETKSKFFTKGSDGALTPKDVKDDPNAEKKPLSHWIEKEDTDDGAEWKGVTKNPVQFFLKNPDKLKNLSTNNRKTMLKKMSKAFKRLSFTKKS